MGEAAFESALRRLGFTTSAELLNLAAQDVPMPASNGFFRRPNANAWHDDAGRAIADFQIMKATRDAHIDVKCHGGWHWLHELQTWQTGVGIDLLREYQCRAFDSSQTKGNAPCSAHVVTIKRGMIPLGKFDGLPLPHHPSPIGVWIAAVDDLLDLGFERAIPGEKGVGMCSTRAIDGGVWHPFAPWCEATRSIIVRRSEDPAAWDAFFAREMQQVVLP
jgi:hypothetical protein